MTINIDDYLECCRCGSENIITEKFGSASGQVCYRLACEDCDYFNDDEGKFTKQSSIEEAKQYFVDSLPRYLKAVILDLSYEATMKENEHNTRLAEAWVVNRCLQDELLRYIQNEDVKHVNEN